MQERLCSEPKKQQQEALRFPMALEEEISLRKNFVGGSKIKTKPVLAVEGRTSRKPCTHCGFEFSQII